MVQFCMACGAPLGDRAKFCHRCGTPRGAAPAGAPTVLPWVVAGIAMLCLLAFIVGQNFRRAPAPAVQPVAAAPRAPDISQMSPQERADRLFNRVMQYVAEGKSDSVAFFSPMAITSFEALAPLSAHQRYDLGLLGVVSGDGAMARAQADTILRSEPTHLLGLILGMRAAGLQLDATARADFSARLKSAFVAERAKRLPEYIDHEADLDAAMREIDGRTPLRP
jgi:hypothetical protein